jgi:hypothetical protein
VPDGTWKLNTKWSRHMDEESAGALV